MDMHSRMSSLPTRSNASHTSRRLSSNSSLSSLSELGMLEQSQHRASPSNSGNKIMYSSSRSSSSSESRSSDGNGNVMKKLGSRFALKRKGAAAGSAGNNDAIEELAVDNNDDEEDAQPLATARPRAGRILTSSTTSSARAPGIYGDLSQSGNTNRLKHRSSLSNLNAPNGSSTGASSNSGNASVHRQAGALRHRASISSMSGSDSGTKSPPATAPRQAATLRHRSSVSSLSGSLSRDITPISPPGTAMHQPASLRHRSSISSLSVAMSKPVIVREAISTQIGGTARPRTMSTTVASAARPSNFPSSTNTNGSGSVTSGIVPVNNARRLSATHTGLASLRSRTTSLISPKATGLTSGMSRQANSGVTSGDTAIARRAIPKSSTTSIARIASSTSSAKSPMTTSNSSISHKSLYSSANTSRQYSTPGAAASSSLTGRERAGRAQNKDVKTEDSPGLEELVYNTTLQMADLKDMLSPIAVSRVSANQSNGNSYSTMYNRMAASPPTPKKTRKCATAQVAMTSIVIKPETNTEMEQEVEYMASPPIKAGLPVVQGTAIHRKTPSKSSSPSPTKIRMNSATAKKSSAIEGPRAGPATTVAHKTILTQDGLPTLPGSRKLMSPPNDQLVPSSLPTSIKVSRYLSHSPAVSTSSASSTTRRKRTVKESTALDVNEMEKLLSNEGFLSPARSFLTTDSNTLLMQDDLSNAMMSPPRVHEGQTSSRRDSDVLAMDSDKGGEKGHDIGILLKAEREKLLQEFQASMKEELENHKAKATKERMELECKLSEKDQELSKQCKELSKLHKLLASDAKTGLELTQMKSQLSKQNTYDTCMRRLNRELEDVRDTLENREMEMAVDLTKNSWKTYEKELAVEREVIDGQLDTLEQLKGLVGHISSCVMRVSVVAQ